MISLRKGENTQLDSGLTKIIVGLGWNPRVGAGEAFDLDAACFMLGENERVRSNADFIFFNQLTSSRGSVRLTGDNLTGEGDGDDEIIFVELTKVPADVAKIVFVATIYEAGKRGQNFGMVDDSYIRVVDQKTNEEIAKFELMEDACLERSLIFGELYKRNGAWKFRALGQGFDGEIRDLARHYGL